jgi:hypothetical protein
MASTYINNSTVDYELYSNATNSATWLNYTGNSTLLNILSNETTYTIPINNIKLSTAAEEYTTGGITPMGYQNYFGKATDIQYGNVIGNYILNDVNYTANLTMGGTVYWGENFPSKRSQLRSNLVIVVKSRACPIQGASPEEQTALETLREIISESDYRKYVKHGFLMVQGSDGDMYQVFRTRSHTKVWRDGKVIEEVCVRIKDAAVPPTDNVIAFRTLIQINAEAFKEMGNRFPMSGDRNVMMGGVGTTFIANNENVFYRAAA